MTAIYDLLFEFYFQELIDQIFPITDEEDFLSNASDQLLKGEDYRIWRLQKRSFLRLVISFSTIFIPPPSAPLKKSLVAIQKSSKQRVNTHKKKLLHIRVLSCLGVFKDRLLSCLRFCGSYH